MMPMQAAVAEAQAADDGVARLEQQAKWWVGSFIWVGFFI